MVYDVFSPEGQYVEQVKLRSDLDLDSLQFLDDRSALATSTDDDLEQVITLQRVTEAG